MEAKKIRPFGRLLLGMTAIGALLLAGAAPVAAHEHEAANAHQGDGQDLANGQNHPRPFVLNTTDGLWYSCEGVASFGPAWFGLETAHHGPDSADPGKADRCYAADANPGVGGDDQNPAIN